jgi:hypothetical protein
LTFHFLCMYPEEAFESESWQFRLENFIGYSLFEFLQKSIATTPRLPFSRRAVLEQLIWYRLAEALIGSTLWKQGFSNGVYYARWHSLIHSSCVTTINNGRLLHSVYSITNTTTYHQASARFLTPLLKPSATVARPQIACISSVPCDIKRNG